MIIKDAEYNKYWCTKTTLLLYSATPILQQVVVPALCMALLFKKQWQVVKDHSLLNPFRRPIRYRLYADFLHGTQG